MKRTRNPDETRQKILNATRQILRDGGFFTQFSLEKVARAAGVSKGGLLHHFPDKESLLCGVAQDVITQFETTVENEQATDDDSGDTGRFTRAYIRAGLTSETHNTTDISPVLLSFLRTTQGNAGDSSRFSYWQEKTENDGLDVVIATIVRLAVDGLLYTEVIDGKPIDETLRRQVIERLLRLSI